MKNILLVVVITMVTSATTRADTIVFGTVEPTGTYNPSGALSVVAGIPGFPRTEIGAGFVSPMNGTISQVEIAFTYEDSVNGITLPPGAVNVFIFGDSNGSPDSASQTFLGSVSPTATLGAPVTNLLSIPVSGGFPVSAGISYWLVLKPAASQMFGEWNFSDPGRSTMLAFWREDIGLTTYPSANAPAFRITADGSYPPIIASDNPAAVASLTGGTPVFGFSSGYSFTPNRNIKITDVGAWDEGSDGLMEDVGVDLSVTSSVRVDLGGATIPAGTRAPLLHGFRYVPLSAPISIGAGGTVFLSSGGQNRLDPFLMNALVTTAPEITVTTGGYFGPNFLFTTKLIVNGDFETGPVEKVGNIYAWTVSGNVATAAEGGTAGNRSAALSITGDSQGNKLYQFFGTSPNQRYDVDFDAAVYGKRTGVPLQLNISVSDNATLLDQTVTPPDANTFDTAQVQFQHYHFTFVADTTFARLQFSDIGSGNATADIVVDNVSVVETPLPYAAWQALYFTDAERNNLSVSGWDADPDGDGIPNSLEFYFNFNPIKPLTPAEAAALPHITNITVPASPSQPSTLILAYRRRIGVGGFLGSSGFFDNWDPIILPTGTSVPTGDGVTETRTLQLSVSLRGFYRVSFPREHPSSASQWSASAGGNGHWYEAVQSPTLTWQQARDYAVDRGGYLATITSAAEKDFIKSLLPEEANPSIGGYKDANGWHWITGEGFDFTNWAPDQPDNSGGNEDRLQLRGSLGSAWNDINSSQSDPFVVEYDN